MNLFDGSKFNKTYFEDGINNGISCYENYRWIPERSYLEASAFIKYAELKSKSRVIDIGCAKGFLVKALRSLGILADGCDVSAYALRFSPAGCWHCSMKKAWEIRENMYTNALLKDVLEHCTYEELPVLLECIHKISEQFTCVVPIGSNGEYNIKEYHKDITHIIIEDVNWWRNTFDHNEWEIKKEDSHIKGLKDNWEHFKDGNHVFHMVRK